MVSDDAHTLRAELLAGGFSPISYDGEKPGELLVEDQVIGARQLGLTDEAIDITPVELVFAG
jgi:zinc protease